MKKIIKYSLLAILMLVTIATLWFYATYGGSGKSFLNMATTPRWPNDSLKIIAVLQEPPGNLDL